jgi:hypothetical protein
MCAHFEAPCYRKREHQGEYGTSLGLGPMNVRLWNDSIKTSDVQRQRKMPLTGALELNIPLPVFDDGETKRVGHD